VFVALGIQHAMRMRRSHVACRLYNILPHYLTNGTDYRAKKVIEYKTGFYLLNKFCLEDF